MRRITSRFVHIALSAAWLWACQETEDAPADLTSTEEPAPPPPSRPKDGGTTTPAGLVTRASRMPAGTGCTPTACVAGKVMAACASDSDCDSAPDAKDGDCDACEITGGPTTENEMFVMMPWCVLPPK